MPTPIQLPAPSDHRPVHVVTIGLRRLDGKPSSVHSTTLAAPICAQISNVVGSYRTNSKSMDRLSALRASYDLDGFVVWLRWVPATSEPVPAPLTVPIEPLELDEGRAALHELPGLTDGGADSASLRSSWFRRLLVRLGVPGAILISQAFNGTLQIIIHRHQWAYWTWMLTIGCLLLIPVVIWWRSDQWLIVPGGVVIRKSFVGKVGESLRLCKAHDSILVVRPLAKANLLEVWNNGKTRKRQATRLETAAFLAAWQSPLPPPSLDRLSDWW